MFGYVRPLTAELRVREAEAYRAFYCGVCKNLGAQCGPFCRLFLRYDFAMLALAMDVVFDKESKTTRGRCSVNPLKRPQMADGMAIRYAADAHGILLVGKAMDDRVDKQAFSSTSLWMLKRAAKEACIRASFLYDAMLRMLEEQGKAERENAGIDEASRPFAEFCETMFAPNEAGKYREALRWLGLHIGKWIYMADALDDFAGDKKKNAFNPLLLHKTREEAVVRTLPLMNLCAEQALAAWDVLPERRHYAIVRNILEMGLFKTAGELSKEKIAKGKKPHG